MPMKCPKILKILAFEDSRKVGLGLWIFYTATFLFVASFILGALGIMSAACEFRLTFDQYVILIGFTATLIGGRKWLDRNYGATPPEKAPDA